MRLCDYYTPAPGGYALSATRAGIDGILDKQALIEAMAQKYSANKQLQDLVLSKVANAGNAADAQLLAWERFLETIPYRREPGEILRNPVEVAKRGGDCDDLTLLAMAGCMALGIPAFSEVIADSSGQGFHIRCVAMLPPTAPKFTVVIDPVHRSEAQWAMAGRDLASASAQFKGTQLGKQRSKNMTQQNGWGSTLTSQKQKKEKMASAGALALFALLIWLSLPPRRQGK